MGRAMGSPLLISRFPEATGMATLESRVRPDPLVAPGGQRPLTWGVYLWVLFIVLTWSSNAVVVKIAVRDLPPLWAAFLRFVVVLPFIALFALRFGRGIRLRGRQWLQVVVLALLFFIQIFLFNLGSRYTTGGRVALIIFSFPLVVPLVAPIFLPDEPLRARTLAGCLLAFSGLLSALWYDLGVQAGDTLRGDLLELASCLTLAVLTVYNKRLTQFMDKWRILFWQQVFGVMLFGAAAAVFENLNPAAVALDAWAALGYQALGITLFCFLSWQRLIARHNSAKLSIFFFAAPLFGMLLGVPLLGEALGRGLLAGALLVGLGIYWVNRPAV